MTTTSSYDDTPPEELGGIDPVSRELAERGFPVSSETYRQQKMLDLIPESKRGDPVPSSSGRQVPDAPNEDEDDANGGNEAARLVNEGIAGAAQEQADQAAQNPPGPDTSTPS